MATYKGASSEGTRAMNLVKQREQRKEEMASRIQALEDETAKAAQIDNKFSSGFDVIDQKVQIKNLL